MLEKVERFQVLLLGLVLAVSGIIGSLIIKSTLSKDVISVTGSYSQNVNSDKGVYEFDIKVKQPTKAMTYKILDKQRPEVIKYLKSQGFKDENIDINAPTGYEIFETNSNGYSTNNVIAYSSSQRISVTSNDVKKIKNLSNDITCLLNKGIDIYGIEPSYYYSKLSDLKVKMLENATKDAKQRASAMLKATNNKVGKIQSLQMGVFQITPVDSTSVSDSGISDTTTIKKKITSVANVTFRVK